MTLNREALDLLFKVLAVECAQLTPKFKALGGIVIGVGIVANVLPGLEASVFHSHFAQAES